MSTIIEQHAERLGCMGVDQVALTRAEEHLDDLREIVGIRSEVRKRGKVAPSTAAIAPPDVDEKFCLRLQHIRERPTNPFVGIAERVGDQGALKDDTHLHVVPHMKARGSRKAHVVLRFGEASCLLGEKESKARRSGAERGGRGVRQRDRSRTRSRESRHVGPNQLI